MTRGLKARLNPRVQQFRNEDLKYTQVKAAEINHAALEKATLATTLGLADLEPSFIDKLRATLSPPQGILGITVLCAEMIADNNVLPILERAVRSSDRGKIGDFITDFDFGFPMTHVIFALFAAEYIPQYKATLEDAASKTVDLGPNLRDSKPSPISREKEYQSLMRSARDNIALLGDDPQGFKLVDYQLERIKSALRLQNSPDIDPFVESLFLAGATFAARLHKIRLPQLVELRKQLS